MALAFDEFGRPFIILRDQGEQERITGLAALKARRQNRFPLAVDNGQLFAHFSIAALSPHCSAASSCISPLSILLTFFLSIAVACGGCQGSGQCHEDLARPEGHGQDACQPRR
jgi:hypothetical protein